MTSEVVDVLTEAFVDDPVVCWVFPDVAERGRLQARFYRSLLAHPAGETYVVGQRAGASVWLTLAAGQAPYEEEQPGFGGARLWAVGQALAERHPSRQPHLYLRCMGVVGRWRGTGLGSAMLRHRLTRADADGLGVYLEASSPRSRALYLRFGFEDLGAPVRVADSPLLWPMWRQPKGEQR